MKVMKKLMKFLRNDESGAVTIEYVAIAVVVAALALSALSTISTTVGARAAALSFTTP